MYICMIIIITIGLSAISYSICKNKIRKENERLKQFYETQYQEQYIKENSEKLKRQIEKDAQFFKEQLKNVEEDLKQRIESYHQLQEAYGELNAKLQDQQQLVAVYEANQKSQVNERIAAYESDQRSIIDARIAIESQEKQRAAELAHETAMADLTSQTEAARAQIVQLQGEIAEYTAQQAAINEAIMRQRELEEKQDFYRVCLAPETANDVAVLNQARQNLKKPEIIDKIIYDNYISKPVLEMIKRVLQNTTCSGIYKITCLKTGEIYIGKSTDVKTRWQSHAKTAFNCGNIAHSLLHTKMKQYGIENFTFELLEKVAKDQLSSRERFYIEFYKSKETGLNERKG